MKQKTGMVHPNFILGLLSYMLLLTGAVLTAGENDFGTMLIIISVFLGGVHWIISMLNVWKDRALKGKEEDNYFWLGLVIMIPPIAGMMYYMLHEKRVTW